MAPVITTAKIVCKSNDAREKVLAAFRKIIEFAIFEEPGVTRYIATVPLNDSSGTDIYMIEEYASPEANALHIATLLVQELISLFTHGDVLASPPLVYNNDIIARKIAHSVVTNPSNPAIILANFEYKPGTAVCALEKWTEYIDYIKRMEEGTRDYAILLREGVDAIRTVEVYESWAYQQGVHLESAAIEATLAHNKNWQVGVRREVRLRAIDGFFCRSEIEVLYDAPSL